MRIGIVGDLHCGSMYALTPESYWNSHTPYEIRWLWNKWIELVTKWPRLDMLILNGDIIDGMQLKSGGTGIQGALDEQAEMAVEALAPLAAKAKRIIRLSGTSYHEGFHGTLKILDAALGVERPPSVAQGIHRYLQLSDDAILSVAHHPEYNGVVYKATVLEKEIRGHRLAEAELNLPRITHMARGHMHIRIPLEGFGVSAMLCPCWSFQNPHGLSRGFTKWRPTIGGTLLVSDKEGHQGFSWRSTTFPLPAVGAERV